MCHNYLYNFFNKKWYNIAKYLKGGNKMKKYLLGAFLVIVMNLFGAKLSDVKGI